MRKLHWPAVVIATLVLLASLTLTPREGAAGEKKFSIRVLNPITVECGDPDGPDERAPQSPAVSHFAFGQLHILVWQNGVTFYISNLRRHQ